MLVIVIVLGAMLGRLQTLSRDKGKVDLVSTVVQFTIRPLALPIGKMFISMGEFGSGVLKAQSLYAQNARLKAQMVGYEAYAERIDFKNEEIDSLRKQLSLPPSTRTPLNVDVIGISAADGSLILNAGSEKGIRPDQPVVNGDGLIGMVKTVSRGESQVSLLTAYGVKIFGVDASRKPPEEGLISGTGASTLTMLILIPKDPAVSGDTILTSLKSKNIPGGVVVGRVISVEDDPYYGTRRLTLAPAVDLGIVHEVQILQ